MLTACSPEGQAQEIKPTATQTIEGLDFSDANEEIELEEGVEIVIETATPDKIREAIVQQQTEQANFTPTPEDTPTPAFTATPEAMTQEKIRAEILAAGVNLDDLASSKDQWTRSHKSIEHLQDDLDNLNFGRETEGAITTVVIGLEGVENPEQLDRALLTDAGWRLTSYAKVAYKSVDGNWQIIKVPLSAYHQERELIWPKDASNRGQHYLDANLIMVFDDNGNLLNINIPFINFWTASNNASNNHWGTGSFIRLDTSWVEDPKYANNDGVIGDPPRYSEEQLIEFRKTGDPSIFGYQDSDGHYLFWPFVTFNADVSALTNYNQE